MPDVSRGVWGRGACGEDPVWSHSSPHMLTELGESMRRNGPRSRVLKSTPGRSQRRAARQAGAFVPDVQAELDAPGSCPGQLSTKLGTVRCGPCLVRAL
eukprot:2947821-Prymnesium_polylepis.1